MKIEHYLEPRRNPRKFRLEAWKENHWTGTVARSLELTAFHKTIILSIIPGLRRLSEEKRE